MLTRIRSPSRRYHVATDTGWPSGRTVLITAGLAAPRKARISSLSVCVMGPILPRLPSRHERRHPARAPWRLSGPGAGGSDAGVGAGDGPRADRGAGRLLRHIGVLSA